MSIARAGSVRWFTEIVNQQRMWNRSWALGVWCEVAVGIAASVYELRAVYNNRAKSLTLKWPKVSSAFRRLN